MTSHPRYLLERPLGEGGMAVVHLATQVTPAGQRLVAIKQIERREEAGRAAHARLVQEARLVFQLTHANICQVLDLGENELGTFIVIEYVHGCDLGDLVGPSGSGLDIGLCLYVAREVARALDYAHRRADAGGRSLGLVHGDVAPGNVLLSVEGEVKLADFGIARARGTTAPGSGLVGGTPGFIAPEVIDGINDLRSDVYSLGMTLAHALAGAPGPEENAVTRALARADLGGAREIILRATAREPTARYPSAGEMERALALELSRRYPGFTPTVLAHVVRGVVAEQEARRGRAAAAAARSEATASTFAMETLIDQPALPPSPVGSTAFGSTHTSPPLAGGTATMVPVRHRGVARQRRRKLALATGGAAAALGASIAIAIAVKSEPPAKAMPVEAATIAAARPAPPQPAATPADLAPLPVAPAPVPAAAPDAGAPPAEPVPADRPSSGRPRAARKTSKPAARESAYVSVSATPWGAVYIDNQRVAAETPLYRHAVPAGRHEIRIFFKEARKFSKPRTVDLQPGQHRSIGFER